MKNFFKKRDEFEEYEDYAEGGIDTADYTEEDYDFGEIDEEYYELEEAGDEGEYYQADELEDEARYYGTDEIEDLEEEDLEEIEDLGDEPEYYETDEIEDLEEEGLEEIESLEDEPGYYRVDEMEDLEEEGPEEIEDLEDEAEYYGAAEIEDMEEEDLGEIESLEDEPEYYGIDEIEDLEEEGLEEIRDLGDEPEYYEIDEIEDLEEDLEEIESLEDEPEYYGIDEIEVLEEESLEEIEDLGDEPEYYGTDEMEDLEEEDLEDIDDLDAEAGYYPLDETQDIEDLDNEGQYFEIEELDELENEEYYASDAEPDDDEYYEMDEYGDEEEYDYEESREEENIFARMITFLSNMTAMDRFVAGIGVLVLVFVIITGSVLISAKISEGQVEAFAELGTELNEVIGESGLMAVADATMAKQEAARLTETGGGTETQDDGQGETAQAPKGSIEVSLNLSSIQQDLKIKFTNKKTTKLIASVPFEVEVTDAGKNTYKLTDEDMDGIIYKNGLTAGKYSVSMVSLSGESYGKYAISTESQQITVKDKIEYKKVDVADEIKTEAEVNVAAEDTKVQEKEVESSNRDTVAFVESTKTEIGEGTYKELNKAAITDPATVSGLFRMDSFRKLANVATNAVSMKKGESSAVATSLAGDFLTWLSDNEEIVSVDGSMTGNMNIITAKKAGTATVTAGNGTDTETFQVTVTDPEAQAQLTLDKESLSVEVGKTATITASCSVTWESSDASVATVDGKGVVTGVKAGKATITARAEDGATKTCTVTVSDPVSGPTSDVSTTISKDKLSIKIGETAVLTATVTGPDPTVVWTSSDTSIATVEPNGTVTGKKAGTVTVTATANNVSASCKVTVKAEGDNSEENGGGEDDEKPNDPDKPDNPSNADAANDTSTALKDNKGNRVYIRNASGEYVAAVYADYYKYDKFYIKAAAYKYTGWQTIDGSVYYYDVNGNVVTGTQVIQGATYHFDSVTGALVTSSGVLGIDVSKWNGNIDWNAVKNSGIHYVIIRCGYRGSSTGALIEDPKFKTNIKGANAAGLKVGVYFFTQAVNEVEAVEEASMVLSLISGHTISYPIFLDVEPSGGRADGISVDTRTAVCNAFCQTIANSGYGTGIYANKTWLNSKIHTGSLGSSYKIWLAQYATAPSYGGKYQMWQYTSKGNVAGIQGNVDMNLSYMSY